MRDYPARLMEEEAASCGQCELTRHEMGRRERRGEETRRECKEASTRQQPEQVTAQCSPARNLRMLHCVLVGGRSIMMGVFTLSTNTEGENKTDNKSPG